jgi:hypothetical protein
MERQARLNRIRELAVKKNDAEMIARVDKLIAKEQEIFQRKGAKMGERATGTPSAPTGKKGGPGAKAPKEKPADEVKTEEGAPQTPPPAAETPAPTPAPAPESAPAPHSRAGPSQLQQCDGNLAHISGDDSQRTRRVVSTIDQD